MTPHREVPSPKVPMALLLHGEESTLLHSDEVTLSREAHSPKAPMVVPQRENHSHSDKHHEPKHNHVGDNHDHDRDEHEDVAKKHLA